jgi:serine/threonine protein kinase
MHRRNAIAKYAQECHGMATAVKADSRETIGKYHVLAKLADGTTGQVFKGHDPSTGQTVAIKLASQALTRDPVLLKRFEQEFRSASNLDHPNLVRGLDFGWTEDRPYIVLEYVDGEDLWKRIERLGRLSETEAIDYIVQVAGGLHEAHKNGIIHRDIKPDNIFLTADDQAKLGDLGLSKDLEEDLELTRPDRGLGTPNFIAPEQFADAKHAGVRCDIYSLGATLYMALTGQVPFSGSGIATILRKKMANDLPGPRQLVPAVSEQVDWAVRRAVLADPERRFASCPEFIAALTGETKNTAPNTSRAPGRPSQRTAKKSKAPERDRRAAVRYECTLPTSCTINLSLHEDAIEWQSQWDAQVLNLSVTGIGLFVARRFEPGTMLTVDLTSGDRTIKRTREMTVLRVVPSDGTGWFLGGALSEHLTRDELRRLL